jgi:hypothetical protein
MQFLGVFAYLIFGLYSHKLSSNTFVKIVKYITSSIKIGNLSPRRTYFLIIIMSCMYKC